MENITRIVEVVNSQLPLFDPGAIVFSRLVGKQVQEHGLEPFAELLFRHVHGDFGEISEDDIQLNYESLAINSHGRVVSSYRLSLENFSEVVWVITDADGAFTTFLLPSEY
ncbi:hypothetical protein [Algicola sagamiensis]|uniref:hypothetical protein n=1 Tax=Algicola sagamiensis TaxID=163869 RepID=UPI000382D727|nr:hypothetical protein [Algicola sagamiensis]